MKKHLLFSIIVLCFAAKATAGITISLQSPAANYALASTNFVIKGTVTSTYEITSVTTTIGTITDTATFASNNGQFSNTFSLASFHEGDTLKLVIVATDHFNNKAFDTVKVIYDNPPELTIASPLPFSAASAGNLTLPLSINCRDLDSCKLAVWFGNRILLTKVKDSFSTTLDLSAFKETVGEIDIQAVDKRNQGSAFLMIRNIYTEGNPVLHDYYFDSYRDNEGSNSTYTVTDFNGSNILSIYTSGLIPGNQFIPGKRLIYTDIAANLHDSVTELTDLGYHILTATTLTPSGAIYSTEDIRAGFLYGYSVYQWFAAQDSTVKNPFKGDQPLAFNSRYVLARDRPHESTESKLILQNITTGQDTALYYYYYGASNYIYPGSLALNGVFACDLGSSGQEHNTVLFANANRQTFVLNHYENYGEYAFPATDGNYVVYYTNGKIRVSDGFIDSVLGSVNIPPVRLNFGTLSPYYRISNKFIAYCKLDVSNKTQVWLRDSLGNNTQLSFFGTASTVDNIDSNGDVIFINNGHRYFAARNGATVEISSANGTTYYVGNKWYLVLGRSIFTIDVQGALPLTLLNFNAQKVNAENLLTWATANEINFSYFGVENSTNGIAFSQIGKVLPKGGGQYEFTHVKPAAAINYYRLRLQDKDGRFTYSPVRSINNLGSISIQLLPNPVSNTLRLTIAGSATQTLQVTIVDMLGRPVITKQLTVAPGVQVQQLNTSMLSSGSYVVKVITPAGDQTSYKFIKQ